MKYEVEIGGTVRTVEIRRDGPATVAVVDGRPVVVDGRPTNANWSLLLADDPGTSGAPGRSPDRDARRTRSHDVAVVEGRHGTMTVYVDGVAVPVVASVVRPGSAARHRSAGAGASGTGPQRVAAPMPGKIVKVLVQPGDAVEARQGLVVVEAMKMENELRAQRPGTVTDVRVQEGMSVEAGTVLVVVE